MMLALVLAVSVSAQSVDGQVPANAGEAELVSAAKKHFKQRQYAEAIAEFQAAYEAEKNSVRLYNIGKCYERLRETGKALRYFREYLRIEPTAARDDVLASEIANAERQLKEQGKQQIVIYAEPIGAQVFVDKVRQESSPAYVELRGAEHLIVVKAEGYKTEERRLKTPLPGGSAEVRFILHPASTPAVADAPKANAGAMESPRLTPPATPATPETLKTAPSTALNAEGKPLRRRVWTLVAGGAALAAGGTAVGLGMAFGGANRELTTFNADRFTAEITSLEKRTAQLETGTNIAMGLAGAAVVAAVVLYFVEAR